MSKPEGKEWVTTYITTEQKKKLRVLAAQAETTVSDLVRQLIAKHIKESKSK